MLYWAIKNTFSLKDIKVEEELLYCGEYAPEFYKARRKYGIEEKGKWTKNWLPLKFANERITSISTVLIKDNEKTKEEIERIEEEDK